MEKSWLYKNVCLIRYDVKQRNVIIDFWPFTKIFKFFLFFKFKISANHTLTSKQ